MKKLLTLTLAAALALTLAACGGDPAPSAPDPATPAPATQAPAVEPAAPAEPEAEPAAMVSMTGNYTTLLVPGDFAEFRDQDGYAISEGVGANIVISPTMPADTRIEDYTEEAMTAQMESAYTNIEVQAFDNPTEIAGVDAVSFLFTGDGVTSGANKTVCSILLFFSLEGEDCVQQVNYTYNTGENTSLEAGILDSILSITLE